MPKPIVLIVMDGWGVSPRVVGNAIAQARTPVMDHLQADYPHTTLNGSGEAVGLPEGQMGNSEVGHLNLGSGMIVYQELTRLDKSIRTGEFFKNPVLLDAIEHAKLRGSSLHLMGLLGPGGVHSHSSHLYALLELAKRQGLDRVFIHAFTDGRDTPPRSGIEYMEQLLAKEKDIGAGKVSTVSGRYYAMDRDNRWDRVAMAYRAIVFGEGGAAESPIEAISSSYREELTDEFIVPTVIEENGRPVATLRDGDSVIFFNFRADRGRELTKAIVLPDFNQFDRGRQIEDLYYVTLTQYQEGLPVHVAFAPMDVRNPLAKILSDRGMRQFHTAETEKYPHVTFFFNGGRETPFPGEERLLVPSPKVPTYDLQPEMSAPAVAKAVVDHIDRDAPDFIIVNFANGDMVGHTGVMEAAIKAAETVDNCVGEIVKAALAKGGLVMVAADHGNAEQEIDYTTSEPFTAHTTNPVPFILVTTEDSPYRHAKLRGGGILADVTPTILQILGIPKLPEMDGETLIADSTA